jgi:two-component system, NarL family, invasion response regulator UvrY
VKSDKGKSSIVKILIADDHALFREGLKKVLSATPDLLVAGEAATGKEVLRMVQKDSYDLVVLDIAMPDKHGLDVLKDLRLRFPDLPILMLSMYPEEQYGVRVLKAGAAGYLTKGSAPDELIAAIRRAASGRKYVGDDLAEKLASELIRGVTGPLHKQLSDREYQIMCMLAEGAKVRDIASSLCLSSTTVSTYRARILDKMGMKSNSDLTRYAVENGLIS